MRQVCRVAKRQCRRLSITCCWFSWIPPVLSTHGPGSDGRWRAITKRRHWPRRSFSTPAKSAVGERTVRVENETRVGSFLLRCSSLFLSRCRPPRKPPSQFEPINTSVIQFTRNSLCVPSRQCFFSLCYGWLILARLGGRPSRGPACRRDYVRPSTARRVFGRLLAVTTRSASSFARVRTIGFHRGLEPVPVLFHSVPSTLLLNCRRPRRF